MTDGRTRIALYKLLQPAVAPRSFPRTRTRTYSPRIYSAWVKSTPIRQLVDNELICDLDIAIFPFFMGFLKSVASPHFQGLTLLNKYFHFFPDPSSIRSSRFTTYCPAAYHYSGTKYEIRKDPFASLNLIHYGKRKSK